MSEQAKQLAERLRVFQEEVTTFIRNCSEEDWKRICDFEQWSVGATARHVAAGHYEAIEMAKNIIRGEQPPQLTMDQIIAMANADALTHADCTQNEVIDILSTNGRNAVEFVTGLNDEDLGRMGNIPAMGDVSAGQFIEMVILGSAGEHFASMKKAISRDI